MRGAPHKRARARHRKLRHAALDITTNRTVTVAGIDQLRAQFNANAWSGRVEGGYRLLSPWMGGMASRRTRQDSSPHSICPPMLNRLWSAPTSLRSPMAQRASRPRAANSACGAISPSLWRWHLHPARACARLQFDRIAGATFKMQFGSNASAERGNLKDHGIVTTTSQAACPPWSRPWRRGRRGRAGCGHSPCPFSLRLAGRCLGRSKSQDGVPAARGGLPGYEYSR